VREVLCLVELCSGLLQQGNHMSYGCGCSQVLLLLPLPLLLQVQAD
jgi:hypothetical protein